MTRGVTGGLLIGRAPCCGEVRSFSVAVSGETTGITVVASPAPGTCCMATVFVSSAALSGEVSSGCPPLEFAAASLCAEPLPEPAPVVGEAGFPADPEGAESFSGAAAPPGEGAKAPAASRLAASGAVISVGEAPDPLGAAAFPAAGPLPTGAVASGAGFAD
ncbi:hypothetical protein JK358_00605 [Nocardia sp. 2]|uniref:Uncharacterized protein n=1 Tax=Nocardia acididurans TaxID=2802282 RepID=A0ABS1LYA5_9NOCA|nr:hypothetical protein [Nocardia acididurans]MBL1072889.1 hypothetical protein [Nocardia acididurans]